MTTVAPSTALLDILSRNANTEIGRRWDFAPIKSVDDFRRNVPLTDYDVYRPYIERMMKNGEKDLIACGNVEFYAPTSGTTSKSKFFPIYAPFKAWAVGLRNTTPPGKTILFSNMFGSMGTPCGVPITPASAKYLHALLSVEPYTYTQPLSRLTALQI